MISSILRRLHELRCHDFVDARDSRQLSSFPVSAIRHPAGADEGAESSRTDRALED